VIWSLLITIVVEFIVTLILIRKDWKKIFWYNLLINCATQPPANFLYNFAQGNFYLLEIIVILVETWLIGKLYELTWKRALLISFCANGLTALIAIIINR
jgi:hypothetical protein